MHCLTATSGKLLWKTPLGDATVDHIWALAHRGGQPRLHRDRVAQRQPVHDGRLVALDLDTGAVLWTHKTVPDRICTTDTAIACTSDADCGTGTCVEGRGAGVTATVATDRAARSST